MPQVVSLKIVALGQSLARGLFVSYESGTPIGAEAFAKVFQEKTGVPFEFVDASVPGTPLLKRYRPRRSWWNEAKNSPGKLLLKAADKLSHADVVIWSQGEHDALDPSLDLAEYEYALRQVFRYIRKEYNCLVVCNFIGRNTYRSDIATEGVAQAQRNVVASLAYVFAGAEQYHVGLCDPVHPDDEGLSHIGLLSGEAVADVCLETQTNHPESVNISIHKTAVVFKLRSQNEWAIHSKKVEGTIDITPKTGESQFQVVRRNVGKLRAKSIFFNGDSSEVVLNFDEIDLVSPLDLSGYIAYGSCADIDLSVLITDNSNLKRPVRRSKISNITHIPKAAKHDRT